MYQETGNKIFHSLESMDANCILLARTACLKTIMLLQSQKIGVILDFLDMYAARLIRK